MNNRGLTLAEVMVAAAILVLVIAGILFSYVTCLDLTEMSKNSSIAVRSSKARLEEIQNTDFSQIKATYNNVSFLTPGFNGIGISYVDDTNPALLLVRVAFCWRQPNGRIIGEDANLNGQLDLGEDKNGNGRLDSIAGLVTYIYDK